MRAVPCHNLIRAENRVIPRCDRSNLMRELNRERYGDTQNLSANPCQNLG